MEKLEMYIIDTRLDDLIEYTTTNALLVSHLVASSILSSIDVDLILAEHSGRARTQLLYKIVVTRRNGYDKLLEALQLTNQSGAASILLEGKRQHLQVEREANADQTTRSVLSAFEIGEGHWSSSTDEVVLESTELNFKSGNTKSIKKRDSPFAKDCAVLSRIISEKNSQIYFVSSICPILSVEKLKLLAEKSDMKIQKLKWHVGFYATCLTLKRNIRWWKPLSPSWRVLYEVEPMKGHSDISAESRMQYLLQTGDISSERLVIILHEGTHDLQEYKKEICKVESEAIKVETLQDSFTWQQLTPEGKEDILNRDVLDQGKSKTVRAVCTSYVYENMEEFKCNFLKDKLLVDLLVYREPPVVFRQTIPPVRGSYIPRRLTQPTLLKHEVFRNLALKERLVLTGFEDLDQLKLAVGKCGETVGSVQKYLTKPNNNIKLLLAEQKEDFENLCAKCHDVTVHLLAYETGQIVWKETRGEYMDTIRKHASGPANQTVIYEEDIHSPNIFQVLQNQNPTTPVIICDSAGMGKTVLLAKLAEKTRMKSSRASIVIFLVMTDFVLAVEDKLNKSHRTKSDQMDVAIRDTIFENLSSYQLEPLLPQEKANKNQNGGVWQYLFFDGLDEVAKDKVPFALECLGHIKTSFGSNVRLHVATRKELKCDLENLFSTLAFSIHPFSEQDQIDFLTKYWSHNRLVNNLAINYIGLKNFAQNVLQTLKETITEKDQLIAGVPMQCLLVGENYTEEGDEIAGTKQPSTSSLNTTGTTHASKTTERQESTVEKQTLLQLYGNIVDRRFTVFQTRLITSQKIRLNKEALYIMHTYISMDTVFSGMDWPRSIILKQNSFRQLSKIFPDLNLTEPNFNAAPSSEHISLGIGLLERVETGNLQFIHRTFAEYFIAKFVVIKLLNCPSVLAEADSNFLELSLFDTTETDLSLGNSKTLRLAEFKLPVVCYFINLLLPIHSVKPAETSRKMGSSVEQILQASICGNLPNILEYFLSPWNNNDEEIAGQLLLLTAHYASPELFDIIYRKFGSVSPSLEMELLLTSVQRGSHSMTVHLLTHGGLNVSLKKTSNLPAQNLIEGCIENTTNSTNLADRARLLNLLIGRCSTESIEKHYILLKAFSSHVNHYLLLEVIKLLKPQATDILITNREGKTILHLLAMTATSQGYEDVLKSLKTCDESAVGVLFRCRDDFGQTPLHAVMRYMKQPSGNLLSAFKFQNAIDYSGYTALYTGVRFQGNLEHMAALIEVNTKQKDPFSRSLLHIAAFYCADVTTIDHLISERELNVNDPDKYGNTPLFYVVRSNKSGAECASLICYLINRGAHVNCANNKGETVFHLIAELGKTELFPLFCGLGSFMQSDKKENSPLHFALRAPICNKLEMIEQIILKYPPIINAVNKAGQGPLHYALTRKHVHLSLPIMQFVVQKLGRMVAPLSQIVLKFVEEQILKQPTEEKDHWKALLSQIRELIESKSTLTGTTNNDDVL